MRSARLITLVAQLAACVCTPGLFACAEAPAPATEIVVSAATSLNDVMTAIGAAYEAQNPGTSVRYNFGASGALEQQIRQGAEVDLFISAAAKQIDALIAANLLDPAGRRIVARNSLVLVVPPGADTSVNEFADLAGESVERVAMGTPESVPAGEYARQTLQRLGLWPAVEPKVVYTANVRQALTYAELDEVDAALVYSTDASGANVRTIAQAPEESHEPIEYVAGLVVDSPRHDAASTYLDFISSRATVAILERFGFLAPIPSPER